jgi:hypothetical protein
MIILTFFSPGPTDIVSSAPFFDIDILLLARVLLAGVPGILYYSMET